MEFKMLTFAALLLTACTAIAVASEPAPEFQKEAKPAEQPFALVGGRSAIRQARNVVVRDEKTFAALWAEHAKMYDGTVPPEPKVDFKKVDVVAVFLGPISTGGHTVEIGDIKKTGKKAVVSATHLKPGPGTMTTQAFTYPFAMKAVPKLPQTVTFEVIEKERPAK
jgi:hypothetical protein